jgi:hypothetical protein
MIWVAYYSEFYQVNVRESIVAEFTNSKGEVDDMMAGLHEVRVRMAEQKYNLQELEKKLIDMKKKPLTLGLREKIG